MKADEKNEDSDLLEGDEEIEQGEFARYQIILPEDDFDDDDELEERVAQAELAKKQRVVRGNFRAT